MTEDGVPERADDLKSVRQDAGDGERRQRQSQEEPENRQGAQAARGEGKPVGLLPASNPARNVELQEMANQANPLSNAI